MTEVKGEPKPEESRADVRAFFGHCGNVTEVKGEPGPEESRADHVRVFFGPRGNVTEVKGVTKARREPC